MPLQAGARLGPYEILSPLGAGGMGEVYKARDTRLERTVAIKVLPDQLADDPQFRDRFEREAKAIAALTHPHICTLYDVGRHDGTEYLVMEFLEGETLENRLKKGAVELDQALKTAIEIASALDKAHRAGIVHRDLKPGNIMLTKTGAKLLDFGLAKSSAPVVAGAGLSMLPTTPPNLTAQGTILGTFQYMAPEQLEGHEADARTDIFAFGAVVYEMLTGKKAFEGKSQVSLIGAILKDTPAPLSTLQPLAPASLDHIVQTCLAKDPGDRWQTAGDVMRQLQWVASASSSVDARTRQVPQRRGALGDARLAWTAAAVLLMAAIGGPIVMTRRTAPVDPPVYRSTIALPANLTGPNFGRLAMSPDSRRLAFVASGAGGQPVLWVRQLDGLTAQPLPGTEGATAPFWSPDSRFIAFTAGGKLRKIAANGGPAVTVCDKLTPLPGAWGADDVILFPDSGTTSVILHVSAAGGTPTPITSLDAKAGEVGHVGPTFLPDGRHFLFVAQTGLAGQGNGVIWASSVDSNSRTHVLDLNTTVRYASGYLLFLQDGTLMARPFDPARLAFQGEAAAVAEHVGITGPAQTGVFSVSQTGALVFQETLATIQSLGAERLTWFDRSVKQLSVLGEPDAYADVELSPDGQRLAVSIPDRAANNARDLWIVDVVRGLRTRLTFDPTAETSPIWSPDGARIVFAVGRAGVNNLDQKPADGSGKSEELLKVDNGTLFPRSWSPEGRYVLFAETSRGAPLTSNGQATDLWILPTTGDRQPRPFLQTPFNRPAARFSPDGRWIAYQSNESGRFEVYVAPFPGPGGTWQVSTAGGAFPRWRRDGKELFYLAPDNRVMAATVNGTGSAFQVGAVQALFETTPAPATRYPYDVTADGQRFLINTDTATAQGVAAPLTLVVNWTAALKK